MTQTPPTKSDQTPFPEEFAALGVRPSILRALAQEKFITPTDIQRMLIPRALAGVDILGQARTGTGKTAAFAIPIIQKVQREGATQALILVPTRELAVQVDAEIKRLAQMTPIRSVPVYGGQRIAAQMKFLKHRPQIVVGTPGRVIDLLDRRIINFDNLRFVVLDEVDRMLDIGFRDDIRNILSRVKKGSGFRGQASVARGDGGTEGGNDDGRSPKLESMTNAEARMGSSAESALSTQDSALSTQDSALPQTHEGGGSDEAGESDAATQRPSDEGETALPIENRKSKIENHLQTIFVSATIDGEIERLARTYMREPVEKLVAPGADEKPTVESVEQYYFSVQPWDKYRLLKALLIRENPELAIVFCRTKHGAHKLARKLHADGIECREIHGDLAQNKRERVMKSFRSGKFDVLVATDLASRGIDVADISHIINYDIPEDPEAYVHRVGRTARMGAAGKAFTFVTREEGEELTRIESLINMVIPQATIEGFEPSPPPPDWSELPPGEAPAQPSRPVVGRFERAYSPSGTRPDAPVSLPARPLTLGSKIPITRRHRRRR